MTPARFSLAPLVAVLTLLVGTIAAVAAGGFYLSIQRPDASADPALRSAVLVVRPIGCKTPSDARLSATAEGRVNGVRRSVPLQLAGRGETGYAIRKQWPASGEWVLSIRGEYGGMISNAVVALGPDGSVPERLDKSVRLYRRKATAAEIDAELDRLATAGDAAQIRTGR